ncbi:uncharacterized protein LOC133324551, partial [Musca vetustissima]|uniref:uncharacterized protein LOC133324551 n=1 Tax=Musca vetustissima TaxID=27455 RepID=UPI002AB7A4D1
PLPKTICTTCLRRVEQHYDLLMRLSRIREERFVELKSRQHVEDLPYVSSPEFSEDDNYHSEDESRRRQSQDPLADNGSPSTSSASADIPSSSTRSNEVGVSNSNSTNVDNDIDINTNVDTLEDFLSSSSSNTTYENNAADQFEMTLPVHND